MKMLNYPGQPEVDDHTEAKATQDNRYECPKCHQPYVTITAPDPYTLMGLIGFLIILGGIIAMMLGVFLHGLLTIIIGILINRLFQGTKIISVCPVCHARAPDRSSFAYMLGRYIGRL